MKIKIVEYNINNGFFDKKDGGQLELNEKRQTAGQNIIKEENPDIFIICESDFVEGQTGSQDYKQIFNYPYGFFVAKSFRDRDFGIGVISKYPIVGSKSGTPENSRWVSVDVDIDGKIIQVNAAHPNPHNTPTEREDLFTEILNTKKEPCILAGDFNALSPQDSIDKEKLIKSFSEKFQNEEKVKKITDELFKMETVNLVLKHNLKDTYKEKNSESDFTYHTKLSGSNYMRLDYIFCSQDFTVIDSGIIKNELVHEASDHYPIYAVLEV